jgi:hypothetical protein
VHFVSHDRNIVAQRAYLHVVQLKFVQRVRRRLHQPCECLPLDARDALRTYQDALVIGESHRSVRVVIPDRLPVSLLELDELLLDRCAIWK